MNIRKPVDYSAMFTALDRLLASELPQMKLYCEIGQGDSFYNVKSSKVQKFKSKAAFRMSANRSCIFCENKL